MSAASLAVYLHSSLLQDHITHTGHWAWAPMLLQWTHGLQSPHSTVAATAVV